MIRFLRYDSVSRSKKGFYILPEFPISWLSRYCSKKMKTHRIIVEK